MCWAPDALQPLLERARFGTPRRKNRGIRCKLNKSVLVGANKWNSSRRWFWLPWRTLLDPLRLTRGVLGWLTRQLSFECGSMIVVPRKSRFGAAGKTLILAVHPAPRTVYSRFNP